MALPGFYNQGDQDIYASGDKFIPQEQYRLGYTAPPSIANASTGIVNTQAANPYIWPPQGGGGGGGGFTNTNKYGLNMDTLKTITSGKYVEKGGPGNMYGGNYVPTERQIAQDEHGNWKDVNTNQNAYHANIGFKGLIGTVGDFLTGKSKNRDDRIGTWTGAEWDEDIDPQFADKRMNTIQRWKAKKEFKAAQEKAAADKAAADQAAAHTRAQGRYDASVASGSEAGHWYGGADYKGGASGDVTQAGPGRDPDDRMAQGGRIGYKWGESVDPEEPAENIFEIMQDQNIPFSEQVEGGPTEEQVAMVRDMDGREMGIDEIVSLTGLGKEVVLSILGVDMAQGGIARLL